MPLLLQLLAFKPEESLRKQLSNKHGVSTLNAREIELTELLVEPRWAKSLSQLLEQLTTAVVCDFENASDARLTQFEKIQPQFSWSCCGVSTAEAIYNLTRKATQDAVVSLGRAATLSLATELTSRLYTTPVDHAHRVKQIVNHLLERDEAITLRDSPSTVFGAARGPMTGVYKIAAQLHRQIEDTLFDELLRACPAPQADPRFRTSRNLEKDPVVNTAGIMGFGPFSTMWGSWASFSATCYAIVANMFRDQFDKNVRETLSDMSTFLRSGFAYTPLTRAVFICRAPQISVDDIQRLHCDDGPALSFPDGFEIFSLRGVPIDPAIILHPESLTTARIDQERNVELRRVLIDRYGIANYLRDTEAGIMDKTEAGTLYLKQQPGDEAIAIVQVRNSTPEPDGTFKEYFLRVPPSMRTVKEAIAWTFGMSAEDYEPEKET